MEIHTESIEAQSSVIPSEQRIISGFWRRILAFLIDIVLMGLFGFILGQSQFDFFAGLGGWGRLVGFGIALIYFGLLNSSIGNGQTVGKRIMGIEVVNRKGEHISLIRASIRYAILSSPFFLNGAMIPQSMYASLLGYIIGFIVFGVGGAIIYLYIFNRRTRQSLPDLLVGTYVVKTMPKGEVQAPNIWYIHLVVVGIWFVVFTVISLFVSHLSQKKIFSELISIQKNIQASGKVNTTSVMLGKMWVLTNGKRVESTYLQVNTAWKRRPDDYEAAAEEIASIILNAYPDVSQKDILSITVSYGYDLGISRGWKGHAYHYKPQEWQMRLKDNIQDSDIKTSNEPDR